MDERELLNRVVNTKDFMRKALLEDSFDDWELARELGEFLIRIDPEDLTHRLILARAYRHLGQETLAISELAKCRAIIESGNVGVIDQEVVIPLVEAEKRLLPPSA
jgi:hypothetical protein